MLNYSHTLLFCISEPYPLSSQLEEDQYLLQRIQCKEKDGKDGIPDVRTYFAILKKKELNANLSHCNLLRSRLSEPHCFFMRKIVQVRRRGGGSSNCWTWELWERKRLD